MVLCVCDGSGLAQCNDPVLWHQWCQCKQTKLYRKVNGNAFIKKREVFLTRAKPTANSIQSVDTATAAIAEQTIKLFVSRVLFVFANSYCSHERERRRRRRRFFFARTFCTYADENETELTLSGAREWVCVCVRVVQCSPAIRLKQRKFTHVCTVNANDADAKMYATRDEHKPSYLQWKAI